MFPKRDPQSGEFCRALLNEFMLVDPGFSFANMAANFVAHFFVATDSLRWKKQQRRRRVWAPGKENSQVERINQATAINTERAPLPQRFGLNGQALWGLGTEVGPIVEQFGGNFYKFFLKNCNDLYFFKVKIFDIFSCGNVSVIIFILDGDHRKEQYPFVLIELIRAQA